MKKITLFMDESGKLNQNDSFIVFGGLVFIGDEYKTTFGRVYASIKNDILKCRTNTENEIKSSNISSNQRRRFLNLLYKEKTFAFIVHNNTIPSWILKQKGANARFIDFILKQLIRNILSQLISENCIDIEEDIELLLNFDQQSMISSGHYCLSESIQEELEFGAYNYDYDNIKKPIINGNIKVHLFYKDSKNNKYIQASDLIAGTIRRGMIGINENNINKLWFNKHYKNKKSD